MRRPLNRSIACLFGLALMLSLAGCGGAPAATPAAPTPAPATATARPTVPAATLTPAASPTLAPVLRVGVDAANPPWCAADGQGTLAGIDVDLLAALGREMGVRIVPVNLAPHLLAAELDRRRVDMIAAGLVSTPERSAGMALSRPYLTLEQVVVVRASDAATRTAGLSGRTVGVQIGSLAAAEARKAGAVVKLYDDLAIALGALARGEVQAVLGDHAMAAAFLRQRPGLGLAVTGALGAGQPVVLGVSRENPTLLARVNDALEALAARGELAALERRWLQ